MTRVQLIIIGAGVILITVLVLVLTGVLPGLRQGNNLTPVKLEVWGVFDDSSAFNGIFSAYQKIRPNVTISYRKFSPDSYEQELVNALAAGTGPNVFMINNTWLPKHIGKLSPAPAGALAVTTVQNLFPRVVEQDFAPNGSVYALPLYIDTLALIYNKDIFDKKGLAIPPADWTALQSALLKIRETDRKGNLTLAGAGIGGSGASVNRASDLLAELMLQTGTRMVDDNFTQANFANDAGRDALRFYTQFADPKNKYYTWNDNFHYSLDAFAEGLVGMIFNYEYNLRTLRDKNPFLRIGVAPLPQINPQARVDYPNYWGLAVSRQSQAADYAWDFIIYATTHPEAISGYLSATHHPPALRTMINEKLNDPTLGVFANQALSARSWPQIDNVAVDKIFSDMIGDIIAGRLDLGEAITRGEAAVTELVRKR